MEAVRKVKLSQVKEIEIFSSIGKTGLNSDLVFECRKTKVMMVYQMGHMEIMKTICEIHGFCSMQLEIPTHVFMHSAEILRNNSPLPLTAIVLAT